MRAGRGSRAAGLMLVLAGASPAAAQDLLGVAAASGLPGQTRDVAVTVRDASGTLLDEGDGQNLEIQGFAFRVDFAPAEHVSAVTFLQAGVTAGRTPVFPFVSSQADHIIVLMSFAETSDPLAFALDAAPPGNLVGVLRFTLSGSVPLDTLIDLTLDPASATLVNSAATLSESVDNGQLALSNGSILITATIFECTFESGNLEDWSVVVGG